MFKAQNIARTLTLLTAVILLSAMPRYAHAQNSSTAPYIDSWHLYRVEMGNTDNTVTWELYDNLGEAADHTLSGTGAWWDAAIVGDNAEIEIKFINTEFASGQTWYLVYTETNIATGACEARRVAPDIVIADNDFMIFADANGDPYCNSWSGLVWDNTIEITSAQSGSITFTVNMSKNTSHLVNVWSFTGTIVTAGTSYENPISSADLFDATELTENRPTDNGHGTFTISWSSGNSFTVTVNVSNTACDADAVTFTANIYGPATNEVDVTLTISAGQAESGTDYTVVTDDNGTGDHDQTQTLWAIPATSVIAVSD